MAEISELPFDLNGINDVNFEEVPQLKYVVEMAEELCPNVGFWLNDTPFFNQGGTLIFLKRYFDGSIDTSFMSTYLDNTDLQKTLEVLGIDMTAFWYLILFLKDYVDDESEGYKKENTAYNDIYNLGAKLYEMGFKNDPIDGEYLGCKNDGLLRLRVGKHWLNITNDKALYGIYNAICSYLRREQPRRRKELIDGVVEELNEWEINVYNQHLFASSTNHQDDIISIPETYRISYFTTYMMMFLQSFSTNNRDWRISKDKFLLISRVIYTIGYSTDVRYNTRRRPNGTDDLDFLKNNYTKEKFRYEIQRTIYV